MCSGLKGLGLLALSLVWLGNRSGKIDFSTLSVISSANDLLLIASSWSMAETM